MPHLPRCPDCGQSDTAPFPEIPPEKRLDSVIYRYDELPVASDSAKSESQWQCNTCGRKFKPDSGQLRETDS